MRVSQRIPARNLKAIIIILGLFVLMASQAPASLITFIYEGSGSGTLDGKVFSASDFVITATGDTNNCIQHSDYVRFIDHISASISIAGLGDFTFLTETRTFVNQHTNRAGLSWVVSSFAGLDLFLAPVDTQFGAWDMLKPIGPVSGSGQLLQWGYEAVNTTGGILVFYDAETDATFTAIPEPATMLLLGLGAMMLRRKK